MATDDLKEQVRHLPDQLRDIAVAAADIDDVHVVGSSSVSAWWHLLQRAAPACTQALTGVISIST